MQEKELDMTKGFDESVGKDDTKTEAEIQAEQDAEMATNIVSNMVNMLSTGQVEVKILKPRRKEAWATRGMLIGVRADFHTHKMWATVAYGAGIDKKINGKKVFVPYSDNFQIDHIKPIKFTPAKVQKDG